MLIDESLLLSTSEQRVTEARGRVEYSVGLW
jgi:hypothetical protein